MSSFQQPAIPSFASDLAPGIRQLSSPEYRNPRQLQPGAVLVVGASNSGAEIALDIARAGDRRDVWLSGRHPGHLPYDIDGTLARFVLSPLLFRFVFHRILTIDTPVGRRARPKFLSKGSPLIRSKPRDLDAAEILQVPRIVGVEGGRPLLEDRALLNVANVIWCAGFTPGFDWIDLPVFSEDGALAHRGGLTETEPGLFFVGLNFLYSLSSTMIQGVGRDAKRIVNAIAARPAVTPRRDAANLPGAASSEFPRGQGAAPSAAIQRAGTGTYQSRA
jgi:putative flavoprotein involved in K+ transport